MVKQLVKLTESPWAQQLDSTLDLRLGQQLEQRLVSQWENRLAVTLGQPWVSMLELLTV